jgi:hypothetical protein
MRMTAAVVKASGPMPAVEQEQHCRHRGGGKRHRERAAREKIEARRTQRGEDRECEPHGLQRIDDEREELWDGIEPDVQIRQKRNAAALAGIEPRHGEQAIAEIEEIAGEEIGQVEQVIGAERLTIRRNQRQEDREIGAIGQRDHEQRQPASPPPFPENHARQDSARGTRGAV